jgi:hypothetical protein
MEGYRTISHRGALLLLLATVIIGGCGPKRSAPNLSEDSLGGDIFELSCERALVHLYQLIEKRSSEEQFPPAKLIEAREYHQMGKELYLKREYELALEIIEAGIKLVQDDSG